eukprot:403344834
MEQSNQRARQALMNKARSPQTRQVTQLASPNRDKIQTVNSNKMAGQDQQQHQYLQSNSQANMNQHNGLMSLHNGYQQTKTNIIQNNHNNQRGASQQNRKLQNHNFNIQQEQLKTNDYNNQIPQHRPVTAGNQGNSGNSASRKSQNQNNQAHKINNKIISNLEQLADKSD